MALTVVPKENIREIKLIKGGPELTPGTIIRKYMTGKEQIRVNKELIIRILESVGIDAGGNNVHKIVMTGNSEFFVDDDGKALLQ